MSSIPRFDNSSEREKLASLRQEWVQAVRDGDSDRLSNLTAEDVTAVLKDGRCVSGKDALRAALQHIFSLYDVERKCLTADVTIRDNWAIELDEMDSIITPVNSGMQVRAHVKTVTVYGRQRDGNWKVVRLLELLD